MKNIEYGIRQVNKLYLQRGFKITYINADCEFETIRVEMADMGIWQNYVSNKEHVSEIEQLNQTTKKRVKSDQSTMPFIHIYKLTIIHHLSTAIFWINAFTPSKPGVVM